MLCSSPRAGWGGGIWQALSISLFLVLASSDASLGFLDWLFCLYRHLGGSSCPIAWFKLTDRPVDESGTDTAQVSWTNSPCRP